MSTKGKLHGDFDVPGEYAGEVIAASLRDGGWRNLHYNDLLLEITGEQNKSKNIGSGLNAKSDFQLTARWQVQSTQSTRITVEVLDREGEATERDCQKMAHGVLKGVNDRKGTLRASLANAKPRTTYGNARWAELEELEKAGYVLDWDDWKGGNQLVLGPWKDGKRLVIPESDTVRHSMVCGPTGCGKSSSLFKPNLFERTQVSAMVTEATPGNNPPDLYTTTSGFRQQQGHQIYYFNPDDMASVRINPLDAVTSISKAQEVADLIIRNTTMTKNTGGDPIWETSERHLLTSLLMHFAPEGGSLADARSLIREGSAGIAKVLDASRTDEARREYRAFMNVSTEGFRNGVLSGLLQRLRLWVNPRIVALTSKTDLDLQALPKQLFTFYLAVPAEKEAIKAVAALVFNFIMNQVVLATDPKDMRYPLALFLDEFTNFGMIPGIARSLTLLRHRKTPIMFGCQDYAQLKDVYGENDAKLFFGQPATRVIFRTPDLETAEKVAKALGKATAVDRKLQTSCTISEREFAKDLMSAAEVMALPKAESIFFTPDTDPVRLQRFSWKDYEEQLSVPPPLREPLEVDDALIKHCAEQETEPHWEDLLEAEQQKKGKKPKPRERTERPIEEPISDTSEVVEEQQTAAPDVIAEDQEEKISAIEEAVQLDPEPAPEDDDDMVPI